MAETTKHRYKPGTGFIYFGVILVVLPLFLLAATGAMTPVTFVMLLAGAACIIIGAVKKSNLRA